MHVHDNRWHLIHGLVGIVSEPSTIRHLIYNLLYTRYDFFFEKLDDGTVLFFSTITVVKPEAVMSRSNMPGFLNFRSSERPSSIRRRIVGTYARNYTVRNGDAMKNPLDLHVPDSVQDQENCMQYNPTTGELRVLGTDIHALQELLHSHLLFSQTFDGYLNNMLNLTWGKSNEALRRKAPAAFTNGSSALAERGASNPNPRVISNAVCATNIIEPNTLNLSNMMWLWGQYVDHALNLTRSNANEPANILTGTSSPVSDPNEAYPDYTIPFDRSVIITDTGTVASPANPRELPNQISSFLDGTQVYGYTTMRANTLRTLDGTGKLKAGVGGNGPTLPYNTFGLDNAMPHGATESDFFIAGDIRSNENTCLTAMHTLWMCEHNRQCDALLVEHPNWVGDDEKLFQQARHRVNGTIQHITYDYYLPALLGNNAIPAYTGYKPFKNATIHTEFSTVAYRLGHAMIPSTLQVGPLVSDTELLRTLFFNPSYIATNGIAGLLQGASKLVMKEINIRIVDDLRNFLFGPPSGNMLLDLATLNIQRGRDHGIPGYNAVRTAYGLGAATNYSDMTSDTSLQTTLDNLYDDVGDVDPWVGCLAEDHVSGAAVGELVKTILVDQFTSVRDGDRYWYEANIALSIKERNDINATTLADVIRRNTTLGATDIADDVFHV